MSDPDAMVFEEAEVFGPPVRTEQHRYGPTGSQNGRGGYLEYNLVNRMEFVRYFNSRMPQGLVSTDLLVLSSTFTRNHPDYRILPPRSLWPAMARTLSFVEAVRAATGVTLTIASAYRSYYINRLSDGAAGSKHLDFAALDLLLSNPGRFRIYLEHYFWQHGNATRLGLGLYNSGRTHVDVGLRPRAQTWPSGRIHARNRAERRFRTEFGARTALITWSTTA